MSKNIVPCNFIWGHYALGVFKKRYDRYIESSHFEKGDNSVTIELEKKSEIPISFTLEGTVIKIITAEGTLSENQYYKIKTDDGNEEYLFDEIGMNQDFEEFVNSFVYPNDKHWGLLIYFILPQIAPQYI